MISTEGKGVGIAPFKDPSQYCVYIDIQYKDGSNLFGQIIAFPEGTHVLQYKYDTPPLVLGIALVNIIAGNLFYQ